FSQEQERAVVEDKMILEKVLRVRIAFAKQAPQPGSTGLLLRAGESENGLFWVSLCRAENFSFQAEVIAHDANGAEGNAGLCHAVWSWIHSEEEDSSVVLGCVALKILPVDMRGIVKGIVDPGNRRSKLVGTETR